MPNTPENSLKGWAGIAVFVVLCALAFVFFRLRERADFREEILTPSAFTVAAGSMSSFPFNVYRSARVIGRFDTTGEGNEITAVIGNADDFETWKAGGSAAVLYRSSKVKHGGIDIPIAPGRHFLVFDNRFSPEADKAIAASIVVTQ
jgi:hypothetical protein